MRSPAVVLLVAFLSVAGCIGDASKSKGLDPVLPPVRVPASALDGALEPDAFTAPVFKLLGAVAKGGPAYGAGEPSISASLDGAIYLSFPGCDRGPYLATVPGQPSCAHGLVYRSLDQGATWKRLNADSNGRLSAKGPAANGDAEVAVDAAGVVYASDLGGGGIQLFRSADQGATWSYVKNLVPKDHWADRQWMAGGAPGQLIAAWMGGATGDKRQVAVTTTLDAGGNWTKVEYLGEDIGWIGPVAFDASTVRAFIPFTQPEGGGGVVPQGQEFALRVARSLDGGITWDVVDTGVKIPTSVQGGHWSGVLMAPALDVTGDGHVVFAWSEEVPDSIGGVTSMGARVRFVASPDGGATWSRPVDVSARPSAIMPWVTAGAGDRIIITYYASDVPLDSDYAGRWDVLAAAVDGVGSPKPTILTSVLDKDVHLGGLCSRGGGCFTSGSDRALLDFFESDVTPDGRLVVSYPSDPPEGGKYIEIRTAIQSGGSPLLVPAAPAAAA